MSGPKFTLSDVIRVHIRNPVLNRWAWIQHKWRDLSEERREKIIFVGNYGVSAVPFTFLFYSLITGLYKNPFILFVDLWILLLFFEYYYKWLREDWKH